MKHTISIVLDVPPFFPPNLQEYAPWVAALSEISHAMSEADSQWRRKQTVTEPSEV